MLDNWGVSPGIQSTDPPVPVKLRSVYMLKTSDGVLEKKYSIQDDASNSGFDLTKYKPVYAKTTGCTLTNAVKEVFYTIESVPTQEK